MNLDINELKVLRSSLDTIDIKGSNAQYLANLQIKLENEISEIEEKVLSSSPTLQDEKKDKKPIEK